MQEFCREVCVDNIKDAMRAVDLGANRIEYCSKLNEEGLTPNVEDVKYLLKNINIPIRIMIRPHSKSFNYSETDISLMLRDISTFKKIDIDTQEVLDAAGTKWNFHEYTPGLVGGHCIGVDPYYLTYKAQEIGFDTKLISAGRSINDYMHEY